MKNFIFIISFLFALALDAQTKGASKITVSPDHKILKGTKFAIIPPSEDFKPIWTPYYGYVNELDESNVSISTLDVNDNGRSFFVRLSNSMQRQGHTLIKEEEVSFDKKAFMLRKFKGMSKISGEGEGIAKFYITYQLMLEHKDAFILIYGRYPADKESALDAAYQRTMKSFVYLEDWTIDPLDKIGFNIDVSNTPFKVQMSQPNMVAFNISGQEPEEEEPSIIVSKFKATPEELEAIGDGNFTMHQHLSALTIKDKKLRVFERPDYTGYEVTAIDYLSDPELIYVAVLRNKDYVYRIRGNTKKDHEGFLAQFRKITESISE
jgi:hypothetical protein